MTPVRQPDMACRATPERHAAVLAFARQLRLALSTRPIAIVLAIAVALSLVIAGAGLSPASAETDDDLDFNTFRLVDNPFPGTTGRQEPAEDAATLYFNECIYRSIIGACTALIETQKGQPRTDAWSQASALRARGAMLESRSKPCSALADYRAALALHRFPGLNTKIAALEQATGGRCGDGLALTIARNGQRQLRSYNEHWRTEAYAGVPPNSRQVFVSGPAPLRPAIFSDDFSPVVLQQADLRRSGLDRSNASLFNVHQSPVVVTSNGRSFTKAAAPARQPDDGHMIVTGALGQNGGGLHQIALFITLFAFTLSAYLMGSVLSRGYQLTADVTGWVTGLFDGRSLPTGRRQRHDATRDPFLLPDFDAYALNSGGDAPVPPPLPGSRAATVVRKRPAPEPVAAAPAALTVTTEADDSTAHATTQASAASSVDDDPFSFFVVPVGGARPPPVAAPGVTIITPEPVVAADAVAVAAPLPDVAVLANDTAPSVSNATVDNDTAGENEADVDEAGDAAGDDIDDTLPTGDVETAAAADLSADDIAAAGVASDVETETAVEPETLPPPAPLPSILVYVMRALNAPRVLRHITTPELRNIAHGQQSLVVIDGEGVFAEQIAALRHAATELSSDRLILIDPSDASAAGLLNPFRCNLRHRDALIARNRFNAAVDAYSLIFEHLLGAAAIQENRIALRRLIEIVHNVPEPSFATLRDMVTTPNRSTLVQHASLLGLDACAAQILELSGSPTYQAFLDRIEARLTFLLSDRAFAAATRYDDTQSDLGSQLADGRLVVLSNRFAKLGAARCSALTTSLLMLAAFRPEREASADGDADTRASRTLAVITTDMQRLLGGATSETEQLFAGIGVGHLQLIRA